MKAADYGAETNSAAAFVSTNSICQGQQVPILWPAIYATGHRISFAHTSFKWANLASHNAGVTVAIIGITKNPGALCRLYSVANDESAQVREVQRINAYLIGGADVVVEKRSTPFSGLHAMDFGNKPVDGGNLLLSRGELKDLGISAAQRARFIRRIYGSEEFIHNKERYALWIEDVDLEEAKKVPAIKSRIDAVRKIRASSSDAGANKMAKTAHQLREMNIGKHHTIVIPGVSSENRPYLPVGIVDSRSAVSDRAFAMFDAPLWNMALIASRLHLVWVGTVCGRLKTDFSYSNTLGWNAFPMPMLAELDEGAEDLVDRDISRLKHVRSAAEIRAADEIASRKLCEDFGRFKPIFERCEKDLAAGLRQSRPIGGETRIEHGDIFILDGLLVYVAEVGKIKKTPNGEQQARLRVIFSNGTESNLLLRSLQRAFYDDEAARRVVSPKSGQLNFGDAWEEEDVETGTIYVLESLSTNPDIASRRQILHKIGVTGGKVETRIANAEHESTYLLAPVEVVATYKLAGINRTKLENLFHRIFAPAQLSITIHDRFGHPVQPREWFLVPLPVIDEAVQRIRDGSITDVVYDPKTARLVERYCTA